MKSLVRAPDTGLITNRQKDIYPKNKVSCIGFQTKLIVNGKVVRDEFPDCKQVLGSKRTSIASLVTDKNATSRDPPLVVGTSKSPLRRRRLPVPTSLCLALVIVGLFTTRRWSLRNPTTTRMRFPAQPPLNPLVHVHPWTQVHPRTDTAMRCEPRVTTSSTPPPQNDEDRAIPPV